MWDTALENLHSPEIIEFGLLQLERNEKGKIWRRHDDRSRFDNLFNALFSNKGAFSACTGISDYPKKKYSATGRLIVPYAAAWIRKQGITEAILIRAATPLPEAVIVSIEDLESFSPASEADALRTLASIFGRGASSHGVRWITQTSLKDPKNLP